MPVPQQWSPWFAWMMDLLKFVITFGFTVVVTVVFVNRLQERLAAQRSRADARFQLKMDALSEFRRSVASYEAAAKAAYTDLYVWKGPDKTAAMQRYEAIAYGDYIAAADGLEHRFQGSAEAMNLTKELRKTHDERHEIYDKPVDAALDSGNFDLRARVTQQRSQFDELWINAIEIRNTIISTVESKLLPPEEASRSWWAIW